MFHRTITEEGESYCNGAVHVLIRPTQVGKRTFAKVVAETSDCRQEGCGDPIEFDSLPDVVEEALGLRIVIPTHMVLLEGGIDSEIDHPTTISEGGSMVTPHRFARGRKILPGSSECISGQTRLIDGGWARTKRIIRNIDGKAHIEECIDDDFSFSDSAWALFHAEGFSRIEAYQIMKTLQDEDLIAPCLQWVRKVSKNFSPRWLPVILDGLQFYKVADCAEFLEYLKIEAPLDGDLDKMKSLLSAARLAVHCQYPNLKRRNGDAASLKHEGYAL